MTNKRRAGAILLYTAATLGLLYLALGFSGGLRRFRVSTISNAPTLAASQYAFWSAWAKPGRNKFIVFRQFDEVLGQEAFWLFRVKGMPGDTVMMQGGQLWVNGQLADGAHDTWLMYEVPLSPTHAAVQPYLQRMGEWGSAMGENMPLQIPLTQAEQQSLQKLLPAGDSVKRMAIDYNPDYFKSLGKTTWTMDDFGPLVVPPNSWFVLGDNRHNAQDSRFIGCIPQQKLAGVVLGH